VSERATTRSGGAPIRAARHGVRHVAPSRGAAARLGRTRHGGAAAREHHIRATLHHPVVDDELTVALRRALGNLLSDRVTLAAAARGLGMSGRSLQRRLAARGTSFREVVRALRCELSLALIERPDVTVHDAAGSLGFAEPSSFSRAFKRWTGLSPRSYRRSPSA
jgi:AraC-like DNA-binding protein